METHLKDKRKHLCDTVLQFSHAGGAGENSCLQDAETDSLKSRSSFQFFVGDVLALLRFICLGYLFPSHGVKLIVIFVAAGEREVA